MAVKSTDVHDPDFDPTAQADAAEANDPLVVRRGGWNMAAKWFILAFLFLFVVMVIWYFAPFGY